MGILNLLFSDKKNNAQQTLLQINEQTKTMDKLQNSCKNVIDEAWQNDRKSEKDLLKLKESGKKIHLLKQEVNTEIEKLKDGTSQSKSPSKTNGLNAGEEITLTEEEVKKLFGQELKDDGEQIKKLRSQLNTALEEYVKKYGELLSQLTVLNELGDKKIPVWIEDCKKNIQTDQQLQEQAKQLNEKFQKKSKELGDYIFHVQEQVKLLKKSVDRQNMSNEEIEKRNKEVEQSKQVLEQLNKVPLLSDEELNKQYVEKVNVFALKLKQSKLAGWIKKAKIALEVADIGWQVEQEKKQEEKNQKKEEKMEEKTDEEIEKKMKLLKELGVIEALKEKEKKIEQQKLEQQKKIEQQKLEQQKQRQKRSKILNVAFSPNNGKSFFEEKEENIEFLSTKNSKWLDSWNLKNKLSDLTSSKKIIESFFLLRTEIVKQKKTVADNSYAVSNRLNNLNNEEKQLSERIKKIDECTNDIDSAQEEVRKLVPSNNCAFYSTTALDVPAKNAFMEVQKGTSYIMVVNKSCCFSGGGDGKSFNEFYYFNGESFTEIDGIGSEKINELGKKLGVTKTGGMSCKINSLKGEQLKFITLTSGHTHSGNKLQITTPGDLDKCLVPFSIQLNNASISKSLFPSKEFFKKKFLVIVKSALEKIVELAKKDVKEIGEFDSKKLSASSISDTEFNKTINKLTSKKYTYSPQFEEKDEYPEISDFCKIIAAQVGLLNVAKIKELQQEREKSLQVANFNKERQIIEEEKKIYIILVDNIKNNQKAINAIEEKKKKIQEFVNKWSNKSALLIGVVSPNYFDDFKKKNEKLCDEMLNVANEIIKLQQEAQDIREKEPQEDTKLDGNRIENIVKNYEKILEKIKQKISTTNLTEIVLQLDQNFDNSFAERKNISNAMEKYVEAQECARKVKFINWKIINKINTQHDVENKEILLQRIKNVAMGLGKTNIEHFTSLKFRVVEGIPAELNNIVGALANVNVNKKISEEVLQEIQPEIFREMRPKVVVPKEVINFQNKQEFDEYIISMKKIVGIVETSNLVLTLGQNFVNFKHDLELFKEVQTTLNNQSSLTLADNKAMEQEITRRKQLLEKITQQGNGRRQFSLVLSQGDFKQYFIDVPGYLNTVILMLGITKPAEIKKEQKTTESIAVRINTISEKETRLDTDILSNQHYKLLGQNIQQRIQKIKNDYVQEKLQLIKLQKTLSHNYGRSILNSIDWCKLQQYDVLKLVNFWDCITRIQENINEVLKEVHKVKPALPQSDIECINNQQKECEEKLKLLRGAIRIKFDEQLRTIKNLGVSPIVLVNNIEGNQKAVNTIKERKKKIQEFINTWSNKSSLLLGIVGHNFDCLSKSEKLYDVMLNAVNKIIKLQQEARDIREKEPQESARLDEEEIEHAIIEGYEKKLEKIQRKISTTNLTGIVLQLDKNFDDSFAERKNIRNAMEKYVEAQEFAKKVKMINWKIINETNTQQDVEKKKSLLQRIKNVATELGQTKIEHFTSLKSRVVEGIPAELNKIVDVLANAHVNEKINGKILKNIQPAIQPEVQPKVKSEIQKEVLPKVQPNPNTQSKISQERQPDAAIPANTTQEKQENQCVTSEQKKKESLGNQQLTEHAGIAEPDVVVPKKVFNFTSKEELDNHIISMAKEVDIIEKSGVVSTTLEKKLFDFKLDLELLKKEQVKLEKLRKALDKNRESFNVICGNCSKSLTQVLPQYSAFDLVNIGKGIARIQESINGVVKEVGEIQLGIATGYMEEMRKLQKECEEKQLILCNAIEVRNRYESLVLEAREGARKKYYISFWLKTKLSNLFGDFGYDKKEREFIGKFVKKAAGCNSCILETEFSADVLSTKGVNTGAMGKSLGGFNTQVDKKQLQSTNVVNMSKSSVLGGVLGFLSKKQKNTSLLNINACANGCDNSK